VAGIAIASRPPQRVFPGIPSLLEMLTARVERLNGMRFPYLTPAQFSRQVGHPLSRHTTRPLYEKLVGRVPQRLMATAVIGVGSRLRFNQERGPLLLVTGGDDRVVPSSVVLANYF